MSDCRRHRSAFSLSGESEILTFDRAVLEFHFISNNWKLFKEFVISNILSVFTSRHFNEERELIHCMLSAIELHHFLFKLSSINTLIAEVVLLFKLKS